MLRRTIRFLLVGALCLASGVANADLPPPIGNVVQPRPPMWVPPAINTDMGRLPGNYCVQIQTAGLPLPGNTPVPPGGYPAITVQVGQIGEPNHIVDIYPQPELEPPPAQDPRCNTPAGGRGGGFGFGPWFAAIGWLLFNPTPLGHDDYISNADLERMRNEPLCCDWTSPPRRRGGAHGDPHFTTFDGLAYDFHGVGEFWLYRSAGQGLEVAGRFVAVGPRLSMTDAAAIAIVDPNDGVRHHLSIFPGLEQKLWLDGQPVAKRATIEGQSEYESMYADMMGYDYAGPTIDVYSRLPGDYYAIDDGTIVSVFGPAGTIEVTRTSVEVQVVEGDARGLLGDFDGDTSNDLSDSAGQLAVSGPGLLSIDEALSTWRVSEAESPFHYFAGESWLAFQDFAFLDTTADPPAPTEAELYEAAMACLDVADPLHRSHCESDFLATGNPDVILAASIAPPSVDVLYEYSDGYQEIVPTEDVVVDYAAYSEDAYSSQYDEPAPSEQDYGGYEPYYE